MFSDDLDRWDGGGVGWGLGRLSKRDEIYVCIYLIHFIVQQ